jgi:hypothetical protein
MDLKDQLDPRLQRRLWRLQRITWGAMGFLLLFAAAGLFGTGFFSTALASADDGDGSAELEYPRFNRRQHPVALLLRVDPGAENASKIEVTFAHEVVERALIRSTIPDADTAAVGSGGATYGFDVDEARGPIVISFEYSVRTWGRFQGDVHVAVDGDLRWELTMHEVVFP